MSCSVKAAVSNQRYHLNVDGPRPVPAKNDSPKTMKVAIIHYWLIGMRGGEKVIEALCEMYPQADIFTHVYVPDMISERIRQHRIIPTFINSLPRAAKMYKAYLPLMPLALEQ